MIQHSITVGDGLMMHGQLCNTPFTALSFTMAAVMRTSLRWRLRDTLNDQLFHLHMHISGDINGGLLNPTSYNMKPAEKP